MFIDHVEAITCPLFLKLLLALFRVRVYTCIRKVTGNIYDE